VSAVDLADTLQSVYVVEVSTFWTTYRKCHQLNRLVGINTSSNGPRSTVVFGTPTLTFSTAKMTS